SRARENHGYGAKSSPANPETRDSTCQETEASHMRAPVPHLHTRCRTCLSSKNFCCGSRKPTEAIYYAYVVTPMWCCLCRHLAKATENSVQIAHLKAAI